MKKKVLVLSVVLMLGFTLIPNIYSQTTQISYQGKLDSAGSPANGSHSFAFRLYDSGTFGNQLGNQLNRTNVDVTDGLFSFNNLDFGIPYENSNIWLEIDVRQGFVGEYTTLTPRQKITSAPTAIQSLKAANADRVGGLLPSLFVRTNDSSYVRTNDFRLTDSRSPTSGSSFYIQNRTSEQSSSNFRISGTGRADKLVAASNISIGTTSTANPLFVFGVGTDAGGVNNIDNVIARFRSSQSAEESAISIDSASGKDSIVYLAENGTSKWQIRADSSTDEFQIRRQDGTSSDTYISVGDFGNSGELPGVKISERLYYPGGIGSLIPAPAPGLCIDVITGSGFLGPCAPSSRKFKKNIKDYRFGIDIIRQLRPVTFNWKQGGYDDFGLIAEEVAEVEPYLALYDKDKAINGVRYDRIGVVLINAFNEQQDQVEFLQRKVEEQNKTMRNLRADFQALKALVCSDSTTAKACNE